MLSNNENVPMTRRYFNLPQKIQRRDSKIISQIIKAWDIEKDRIKVFEIFCKKHQLLSSQRYWEILRSVWIISGGLDNVSVFKKFMTSNRKNKYCFSTPEEAKLLKEMSDTFELHRACNEENDGGISWTYSLEYAKWYRDSFSKSLIITKTFNRDDIFAFINRNNEHEFLILKNHTL